MQNFDITKQFSLLHKFNIVLPVIKYDGDPGIIDDTTSSWGRHRQNTRCVNTGTNTSRTTNWLQIKRAGVRRAHDSRLRRQQSLNSNQFPTRSEQVYLTGHFRLLPAAGDREMGREMGGRGEVVAGVYTTVPGEDRELTRLGCIRRSYIPCHLVSSSWVWPLASPAQPPPLSPVSCHVTELLWRHVHLFFISSRVTWQSCCDVMFLCFYFVTCHLTELWRHGHLCFISSSTLFWSTSVPVPLGHSAHLIFSVHNAWIVSFKDLRIQDRCIVRNVTYSIDKIYIITYNFEWQLPNNVDIGKFPEICNGLRLCQVQLVCESIRWQVHGGYWPGHNVTGG